MTSSFKAACIQNCAGSDMVANISDCDELIRESAAAGADLIITPEFFTCLDVDHNGLQVGAYPEQTHPALSHYQLLAQQLNVSLLLGSLAIQEKPTVLLNRSYLIDKDGVIQARYDKLHMFDVDLANGECYRESDKFTPGNSATVIDTPWGGIGLSVCYDLRFAYLYRSLAHQGASFLTVPAAFMKTTGQAHWHVLLRARAIETGSFVFAPCQYGRHGKAITYGHSLIVDPWGEVLADAGEERGFVIADIDPDKVNQARSMIPALVHDRDYKMSGTDTISVAAG